MSEQFDLVIVGGGLGGARVGNDAERRADLAYQLLSTEDWDAAGHAYVAEHDRHARGTHLGNTWYTQFFLETGPESDARRARATPLIAQNPTRQPDTLFSGPDVPLDEEVRKRFFAED